MHMHPDKTETPPPRRALQVDEFRYVIPVSEVYFEGYEVQKLTPFQDKAQLQAFLDGVARRASQSGFETEKLEIDENGGIHGHWGLLPPTTYEFAGKLRLKRVKRTRIDGYDERGRPKKWPVNDAWYILALNTGDVSSNYGKWGIFPGSPQARTNFMDGVSVINLLPRN